jgi:hypothetical protein
MLVQQRLFLIYHSIPLSHDRQRQHEIRQLIGSHGLVELASYRVDAAIHTHYTAHNRFKLAQ